ncbi:RNA-binding domain-containing protein [Macrolepiota fuliginosa MF-IS2]|uniref:RNA-binding domain-containing protein n=1 Tax=Macrolepiota fuliginosa MF-IS2 TaxID=1400762 RepID=A0A9P5XML9_9AGAR|nr:RNA-binding domain-containing protein [Macrolepiota fuliginosa MF-IS2]
MPTQPNPTLYVNNLNDKVNSDELRSQLYALFTTHGKIIDIIASKSEKMRGQAFLVFSDLAGATAALRACEGMIFYDKPLRIDYARSKSYATLRREDPNFVPPSSAHANPLLQQNGKRPRDSDAAHAERAAKREKSDDSDEEMEIEEEDDPGQQHEASSATPAAVPQQTSTSTARLLCTNLPQEVTDDVLSVLFQQYQGLRSTQVTWSPTPNAAGARVKMAQIIYENAELASTAKEALDGFILKKGWPMSVVYI